MEEGRTTFRIPGSFDQLVYERNEDGRLLRLTGGGRVYVDAIDEAQTIYDAGFVIAEQTELPGGLLRTMRADGRTWIESFAWDAKGLLTEIDGVKVGYDDQQRIASCRGAGGEWIYAYSGPYLAVIDTPHGLRQITRAEDGRPLAVRTTLPRESCSAGKLRGAPAGSPRDYARSRERRCNFRRPASKRA